MTTKRYCISFLLIFVFILASCSHGDRFSEGTIIVDPEFTKESDYSIAALADGELIYQTLEDPTCFFSLDVRQNSEVELGQVSNFILNGYSLVKDSGKLYTYIAVSEFGAIKNVLYEIDYTNDTIRPLLSNQNSSPIIYLYKVPTGILQLKTPLAGSSTTLFELYNLQTGTSTEVLVAPENEIYIVASIDDDSLFVLTAREMPDQIYKFTIDEYDLETYELINTIELSEIHSYLSNARIGKMEVFGDYIYLLNYSNEGIICKLSDNSVIPVLERTNLECVRNQQQKLHNPEMLFYIRNTNECFLFDLNTGETKEIEPKIENGYVISSIFSDGDDILLQAKKPSNNKLIEEKTIIYFYAYSSFITSET